MIGPAALARSRSLVLAAMIFAVAMTFIDQTIVSIAAPRIQSELGLSATGLQWVVNAYLLALAALFAFGGRLADTVGHRRMVVLGVVVFAGASALCGLTPEGAAAEPWLIAFRAVQGAGGAIMYPAALAIVVDAFPIRERGRALALFFGVAGGLTAVGPILGGWLTAWTWRAIFWVNVPVAVVALVLTAKARPVDPHRREPMDYRGLALIVPGVGLSVFGFQQSGVWGWHNPGIWACLVAGAALLVAFGRVQRRTRSPLIHTELFADRAFLAQNIVLAVAMAAFIPTFFFTSLYAEASLGAGADRASLDLLFFFIGFVVAAQIGGALLDRRGAKRPVVLGCLISSVGYFLWAGQVTQLNEGSITCFVIVTGAGTGLMLGQANTDALNRAPRSKYGEATGITQTVRNYGSSLGFAILGTIFTTVLRNRLTASLMARGVSADQARHQAARSSGLGGEGSGSGSGSGSGGMLPRFVRMDYADAISSVLYTMAGIMSLAFVIALFALRRGVQTKTADEFGHSAGSASGGGGDQPPTHAPVEQ